MLKIRILKFPEVRNGCRNSDSDRKKQPHVKDGSALMASLTFNRHRKKDSRNKTIFDISPKLRKVNYTL